MIWSDLTNCLNNLWAIKELVTMESWEEEKKRSPFMFPFKPIWFRWKSFVNSQFTHGNDRSRLKKWPRKKERDQNDETLKNSFIWFHSSIRILLNCLIDCLNAWMNGYSLFFYLKRIKIGQTEEDDDTKNKRYQNQVYTISLLYIDCNTVYTVLLMVKIHSNFMLSPRVCILTLINDILLMFFFSALNAIWC